MAPANDPEIVIGIVIDEPKSGARDGGGVAAPIFREIAQQILQELNVAPDAPVKQEERVAQDIPETPDTGVTNTLPVETKPVAGTKPKVAQPAATPKLKEPKKPVDKKIDEPGKLTALSPRRYYSQDLLLIRKTKS